MNPQRYERFARNVFGVQSGEEGVEAFRNWIVKIDAPVSLKEVHIPENGIHPLAAHIFRTIQMAGMQELYPIETLTDLLSSMR